MIKTNFPASQTRVMAWYLRKVGCTKYVFGKNTYKKRENIKIMFKIWGML